MAYMPELKRPQHEKFCRSYVKHSNAARAYREAYGHQPSYWVKASAWNLLNYNRKVKARIKELRRQMARRADITEDKILTDYQEAFELAKGKQDASTMVSAATAQAKLVGLLKDRIETGGPGDFDTMTSVSDILAAVGEQVGPEAALALAKVLGVENPETPPMQPSSEPTEEQADLGGLRPLTDSVN